jgi:hypothetical protein
MHQQEMAEPLDGIVDSKRMWPSDEFVNAQQDQWNKVGRINAKEPANPKRPPPRLPHIAQVDAKAADREEYGDPVPTQCGRIIGKDGEIFRPQWKPVSPLKCVLLISRKQGMIDKHHGHRETAKAVEKVEVLAMGWGGLGQGGFGMSHAASVKSTLFFVGSPGPESRSRR